MLMTIRRQSGQKTVATPVGQDIRPAVTTKSDPALLNALARAFRYQRLLDEGRYSSISEMAAAEKIERTYLSTLLRLTLLASDIMEAILDGLPPEGLGLPQLMAPFSAACAELRVALSVVHRQPP
jgi:hypothetical protein